MKKENLILKNQRGFTLVEIIAVLVILGILAAVAVPKYFDMQEKAEARSVKDAYNNMVGRAKSKFHKSVLDNGTPVVADYDEFGDLGLDNSSDKLSTIFRDYQGTWAGGGSGTITYAAKNGSTTYTFTMGTPIAASTAGPGSIQVTPPLP